MVYPIKTNPVFKQYIWGGDTLKKKYNKDIPDNFAAESWELSCHSDGLCTAANGEYKGQTLKSVIENHTDEMLGRFKYEQFPLLVKFLDAKNKLSVQVHPDDTYAAAHENGSLGKTEMWYVIDAKPGAKLVYGLKPGTSKEEFESAVNDGQIESVLNFVPVKKGDSFFIPCGTVHAICEGLLIAEIQQSSNTTYRVYDYDRTDANGNKRELQTQKAIDVINYSFAPKAHSEKSFASGDASCSLLSECEYFAVIKYSLKGSCKITPFGERFEMLIYTEGNGTLLYSGGSIDIKAGDSVFIPAKLGKYSARGKLEFLRSFVPSKGERIVE